MAYRNNYSRKLLQRRSNISNIIQQLLDGVAVIGTSYAFIYHHLGGVYSAYINFILVQLVVMALVYDRFAIYRSNGHLVEKGLNLFKAWTVTFLILIVVGFLAKQSANYSRYLISELFILGFLIQLFMHLVFRFVYQKYILSTQQNEKVLIVGQSRLAYYLQHKISNNPWVGEQVAGFVSIPGETAVASGRKAAGRKNDPVILGSVESLPALIDQHNISTVYIVTQLKSPIDLENIYAAILDKHVAIHWIPDIFSLRLVNHSVKEISGIPVLTLAETPLIGMRLLLKSVVDKVLSTIILLLIFPILLIVAIAIKLDSPGPVFFRQSRAGWSGKKFKIWKFRSMHVHQEETGKLKQASKNDSRITRVGAFIRKTSLDELPQVFNVLTGDMSLVGPRPHAIQHDAEYSERISDYFTRHQIKPGITGLAQVRGLRGETTDIEQMVLRIESDIEYINNWSIWLDISILFRTVFSFTGKGAY
ncbi:MAG: undecaprenyl-phosphate glucose phosphotransferase [Methylophilaceae bacterium]